jgi:hypothetical protein
MKFELSQLVDFVRVRPENHPDCRGPSSPKASVAPVFQLRSRTSGRPTFMARCHCTSASNPGGLAMIGYTVLRIGRPMMGRAKKNTQDSTP